MAKLNVGVIGLGRMGRIYAADLAATIRNANLVAVADAREEQAASFAQEYNIPRYYSDFRELLKDKDVDAVAVVTPTHTHRDVVIEAAHSQKAIFCEKPISLSLAEAADIQKAVESTGVFFQMGFQRRFDSGYVEAKKKIDADIIGEPAVLSATSRDPFAPPLEFCDPASSGGMITDLGIHDFDVARMFMGDVKSVYSVGGAFAYPDLATIGDIDNATVSICFESGKIGVVNLSRNAVFGYDIRAEVWGTKGSLQIGYFRETPILVLTREGIAHDVVPHFMQRFERAYREQMQNFVTNVLESKISPVSIADGMAALEISIAATRSLKENRVVVIGED